LLIASIKGLRASTPGRGRHRRHGRKGWRRIETPEMIFKNVLRSTFPKRGGNFFSAINTISAPWKDWAFA